MRDDFRFVMAGDIFLTRSHTKSGKINAAYQRFRRPRKSDCKIDFVPTHAALALSGGSVIQSNKTSYGPTGQRFGKLRAAFHLFVELLQAGTEAARRHPARNTLAFGVSVDLLDDFLRDLPPQDVLLLRHPDLNNFDPELLARLLSEALYHVDMSYNFLVELSEGKGTAVFCSQLVHQVYTGAGVKLPDAMPNRVLPIDILNWAERGGWKIVNGETVLNSLALYSNESTKYATNAVLASVDTHRAAVRRIRAAIAAKAALEDFGRAAERFISEQDLIAFSADHWMSIDAKAVPIFSDGLLASVERVREVAGKLIDPNLLLGANTKPSIRQSDRAKKPLSFLLDSLAPVPKIDVKSLKRQEAAASRFLNFADEILCELDRSAKEALSLLPACEGDKAGEKLPNDLKSSFMESPALKRLLFVASFFERSEGAEALAKISSDIHARTAPIYNQLEQINEEISSLVTKAGTWEALAQNKTPAILARIRLLYLYAVVDDFVSAAQWLQVFDGNISLRDTVQLFADEDYSALVQCFTQLADLPNYRAEVQKIEQGLYLNSRPAKE